MQLFVLLIARFLLNLKLVLQLEKLFFHFILDIINQLCLIIWIILIEGRNEVFKVFFLFEDYFFEIPIIHNEFEMISCSYLVANFLSTIKSVTHNSYKHV